MNSHYKIRRIAIALAGLGPGLREIQHRLEIIERRQTYALMCELAHRRERRRTDNINLNLEELKIFSQNGEDGILSALLDIIGDSPQFFVEFGVQDGSECNTRLLAEFFGWGGVYYEPHPPSYERLLARYAHRHHVVVRNDAVTPTNIANLFERDHIPDRFSILSIDVDGQDYWIWQALPQRFRPDIVIIEYNSSYSPDAYFVEERGLEFQDIRTNVFGASIAAIRALGLKRGYELVHCDSAGVNAILVRSDLLARHDFPVKGITHRDANYYLKGEGHPKGQPRPTVSLGRTPCLPDAEENR